MTQLTIFTQDLILLLWYDPHNQESLVVLVPNNCKRLKIIEVGSIGHFSLRFSHDRTDLLRAFDLFQHIQCNITQKSTL